MLRISETKCCVMLKMLVLCAVIVSLIFPPHIILTNSVQAAVLDLPEAGEKIIPTEDYAPALIRGMTIYPDNPMQFDFIVDRGEDNIQGELLKEQGLKMVKYFFAALTVPDDDLWVNLSPYEKERIIPTGLGVTELGRDMLAQDYMLKQLTASLIHPEDTLGNDFWNRVYKKAYDKYGTINIPISTFNKVWIVPEHAMVYEDWPNAYIAESHLTVMLEEDYFALNKNLQDKSEESDTIAVEQEDAEQLSEISAKVIKEIILPEIEKEVNEGSHFAQLRQIYSAMILAMWYKRRLKESLLGHVYMDQNKVAGVDIKDKEMKLKIYNQYIAAFKKGVCDLIKEEYDPGEKRMIPRKYFSGGLMKPQKLSILSSPVDLRQGHTVIGPQDASRLSTLTVFGYDIGQSGDVDAALLPSASPVTEFLIKVNEQNVTAIDVTGSDIITGYRIAELEAEGVPVVLLAEKERDTKISSSITKATFNVIKGEQGPLLEVENKLATETSTSVSRKVDTFSSGSEEVNAETISTQITEFNTTNESKLAEITSGNPRVYLSHKRDKSVPANNLLLYSQFDSIAGDFNFVFPHIENAAPFPSRAEFHYNRVGAMLAEVSYMDAAGMGLELYWAQQAGIPIILLVEESKRKQAEQIAQFMNYDKAKIVAYNNLSQEMSIIKQSIETLSSSPITEFPITVNGKFGKAVDVTGSDILTGYRIAELEAEGVPVVLLAEKDRDTKISSSITKATFNVVKGEQGPLLEVENKLVTETSTSIGRKVDTFSAGSEEVNAETISTQITEFNTTNETKLAEITSDNPRVYLSHKRDKSVPANNLLLYSQFDSIAGDFNFVFPHIENAAPFPSRAEFHYNRVGAMLAEVSYMDAAGMGLEIFWAKQAGVPIILLVEESKISQAEEIEDFLNYSKARVVSYTNLEQAMPEIKKNINELSSSPVTYAAPSEILKMKPLDFLNGDASLHYSDQATTLRKIGVLQHGIARAYVVSDLLRSFMHKEGPARMTDLQNMLDSIKEMEYIDPETGATKTLAEEVSEAAVPVIREEIREMIKPSIEWDIDTDEFSGENTLYVDADATDTWVEEGADDDAMVKNLVRNNAIRYEEHVNIAAEKKVGEMIGAAYGEFNSAATEELQQAAWLRFTKLILGDYDIKVQVDDTEIDYHVPKVEKSDINEHVKLHKIIDKALDDLEITRESMGDITAPVVLTIVTRKEEGRTEAFFAREDEEVRGKLAAAGVKAVRVIGTTQDGARIPVLKDGRYVSPGLYTPYKGDKKEDAEFSGRDGYTNVQALDETATRERADAIREARAVANSSPIVSGGIDFNPLYLDLQIKRDDKGMPLPLVDQPIDNIQIQGILPIITGVTNGIMVSFPLLLSDKEETEEAPGVDVLSGFNRVSSAVLNLSQNNSSSIRNINRFGN